MENVTVIHFGLGEVVTNWGTFEGHPAVFIEPAIVPGAVGERETDDEHEVRNAVRPGTIVLQFHNPDGAAILKQDIDSALNKRSEA